MCVHVCVVRFIKVCFLWYGEMSEKKPAEATPGVPGVAEGQGDDGSALIVISIYRKKNGVPYLAQRIIGFTDPQIESIVKNLGEGEGSV